jgi:hypothetical protein
MNKMITEDGQEHHLFEISINTTDYNDPFVVYATADNVEKEALKFSRLLPTHTIRIEKYGRVKATYMNGKRKLLRDYKEFYPHIASGKYETTKIRCSKTDELM